MNDVGESNANKQLRLQQEAECRRLADELKGKMRPGVGFALFLFDYGEGNLSYVSSAQREDMLAAIAEWLAYADPKFRDWYDQKRETRGE